MSNAESAPEQSQVRSLLRLALLGALVGLPTGLVSFAFISIVHWLEVWMWDDLPLLLGIHRSETAAAGFHVVIGHVKSSTG